MSGGRGPARVRQRHVEWTAERLSERDGAIVATVNRLRLVTGAQLERLHFTDLTGRSRAVVRWRVLKRLVDWHVLVPLARRIGGPTHGSAQLVYSLDSTGQALTQLAATGRADTSAVRRPGLPGDRFIAHTLAVSELYVRLTEATAAGGFQLAAFEAEPASWVPNGLGGWLKPDAYTVLRTAEYDDAWWIEVDRATEHLPTIKRKLMAYVDFVNRGQLGPTGIVPRVLITVPSEKRRDDVTQLISQLPSPAEKLLHVALFERAINHLLQVLRE